MLFFKKKAMVQEQEKCKSCKELKVIKLNLYLLKQEQQRTECAKCFVKELHREEREKVAYDAEEFDFSVNILGIVNKEKINFKCPYRDTNYKICRAVDKETYKKAYKEKTEKFKKENEVGYLKCKLNL